MHFGNRDLYIREGASEVGLIDDHHFFGIPIFIRTEVISRRKSQLSLYNRNYDNARDSILLRF